MKVEKNEVKEILKSLPVGYYLGRKIEVMYEDEAETSYYDPMKDEIHIAFNNVYEACSNLPDDSTTNLESLVRDILYHELSHVLLTPQWYNVTKLWNAAMNIFEDERIETRLKDFYHDVDFVEFKKLALNVNPDEMPKNTQELFFDVVRFNVGPLKLLEEKEDILKNYIMIDGSYNSSQEYTLSGYYNRVQSLWNDCERWMRDLQQSQSQQSQQSQSQENNSQENASQGQGSQESQSQDSQENDSQNSQSQESQSGQSKEWKEILEKDKANTSSYVEEDIRDDEELVKSCIERYDLTNVEKILDKLQSGKLDTSLSDQFEKIFLSYKSHHNQNSSAIPSYSGQFNPRLATREDYKMWNQKNRSGHVRQFSKVKLNLFIDNSGSMDRNTNQINKLLYNLNKLSKESSDFTYDVVLCGGNNTVKLFDKDKDIYSARGNTGIDEKIIPVYKKLNQNNYENINIVMFDGYAFNCFANPKDYWRYAGTFNSSSCICIVDTSNEKAFKKYCPKAKNIIINSYYTETFINEVVKALMLKLR